MAEDVALSPPLPAADRRDHLEQVPTVLGSLRYDVPASLVVMLVALPLCLGIAVASGAPPLAGIIAGVAGGIVVPLVSRAPISVSGPAAGLVAIVLAGITAVGMPAFALAVVLAGLMQIGLGALRAGRIATWFPSSVVSGMLAAIGVMLILKQIPHAVGWDAEAFGSEEFVAAGENTFSRIPHAFSALSMGAVAVAAISIVVLLAFEKVDALKRQSFVPGPLAAVAAGTGLHELLLRYVPALGLSSEHLVALPAGSALVEAIRPPDVAALLRPEVWMIAVTLMVVASLETLLNVDAMDRLDPYVRNSPPNRELVAQGLGNIASGLLGGLPITSVVVRSSASLHAGGRTRAVAFLHGVLLLLAVLAATPLLVRIPLSSLAAILLLTGFKLAKPAVFKAARARGVDHFVPFLATIGAVVFTDLLKGVLFGFAVALVFVLRRTATRVIEVERSGQDVTIRLGRDVPFFARPRLQAVFEEVPENSRVLVDAPPQASIHHDVLETIRIFGITAPKRRIQLQTNGLPAS